MEKGLEQPSYQPENQSENNAAPETAGKSIDHETDEKNTELAALKKEKERLDEEKRQLAEKVEELTAENKRLEELATVDLLTGLNNRRGFEKEFEIIINKKRSPESERRNPEQEHESGAVLILDIDDFKKINDTYGHPAGDEVLRQAAAHLQSMIRATDLICRWGGEEFVAVMQNLNAKQVIEKFDAERTGQAKIEFTATVAAGGKEISIPITFSGGTVDITEKDDIETIIHAADQLLYMSKKEGKNRIYSASAEGEKNSEDAENAAR